MKIKYETSRTAYAKAKIYILVHKSTSSFVYSTTFSFLRIDLTLAGGAGFLRPLLHLQLRFLLHLMLLLMQGFWMDLLRETQPVVRLGLRETAAEHVNTLSSSESFDVLTWVNVLNKCLRSHRLSDGCNELSE